MNAIKIFCFWEPPGSMPAYLRLCFATWARHLSDYEIIVLNYANLDRYVPPGTYDLDALKKLPLGTLKDAILAAVLCEHGGVFMDVDTIVTGDIAPIISKLRHAEIVLFNVHLGFAAARRGPRILRRWTEEAQRKLLRLNENDDF